MRESNLAQNLHLLCGYYRSIAEVCRRLGVNRQQFNKYLSGSTVPSRHNMRRICDFFGVTEAELFLSPGRFAELVTLSPRRRVEPAGSTPGADFLGSIGASVQRLPDRYYGYYFRYFYSFAYPGYITKSFVALFQKDNVPYWKNIEILRRRGRDRPRETFTFKYVGLIHLIAERLYVIEYETILKGSLTQTILYPSYRSHVTFLTGVQTALATPGRRPSASRVLFEHLGTRIDIRRALRSCGHFHHEGDAIDPAIKDRIKNDPLPGDFIFSVSEG